MKQVIIAIIVTLFLPRELFSQARVEYQQSLGFHIMPVTLVDYTPRWRLGIQYDSGKQWGSSLDLGIGRYGLNMGRLEGMIWSEDYSLYEIRPELRYFLKREEGLTFFAATEAFFIKMRDHLGNGYFHYEDSELVAYYDQAVFNKYKVGFHLKGGAKALFRDRIYIEAYGGLGLAYRKINYTNVENPEVGHFNVFEEWWGHGYKYEGGSVIGHITLGMKLGLLFWKGI